MSVIYDAGMLIALDRGDRRAWQVHKNYVQIDVKPFVPAPVLAQVYRSPRQARLRMALKECEVFEFRVQDATPVGALLGVARTSDVVDGHVVLTGSGMAIFTSDPEDLELLAAFVFPRPTIRRVA